MFSQSAQILLQSCSYATCNWPVHHTDDQSSINVKYNKKKVQTKSTKVLEVHGW